MTLSQKVEPWDGKASVSLLDFVLTDVNQEMLALISPSVTVSEILLKRVEFYVGYETIGYPDDYIRLYRGFISGVGYEPSVVTLKTSDPNILRRQKLFEKSTAKLTSGINDTVTTIPVDTTDGFYRLINAPASASPESGHQVGIKIDDEIMTYTASPNTNDFTVVRGALGSVASTHSIDSEVTPVFYFTGNPLRTACKIMLSGWGGTHSENSIQVLSFVNTSDPAIPIQLQGIVFGNDVVDKYGLIVGDYVSITGSASNDFTERAITGFFDVGGNANRGILVDGAALTPESIGASASFRSQFDVYPVECGIKMKMIDVDTDRHITTANQFIIDDVANLQFTITAEEDSGKTFIEKELYVPIGAFSLTRAGKCSVVITAPPLPLYSIITLNADNVIDADKARTERALNTRKFYNRVDISYDYNPINDDFATYEKYIDSDSVTLIDYKELIEIESKGMRTELNATALIDRTQRRIFERYAFAAQTINFKVNWSVGALLEAGDIVLIEDEGGLNFPDLTTGQLGLPPQLWEVLEKSTDLKTGQTTLTIINGLGTQVTDRYGTISPSSEIESGLSTSQFRIKESFGSFFLDREYKKWEGFVGYNVSVFSPDGTVYGESVLTQIDAADQFLLTVDPPLAFVPNSNYVLNLAEYSVLPDVNDQSVAKIQHAFLSPIVEVVSGIDGTQFTVSAPDYLKFWVGGIVVVHDADYTVISDEVLVTAKSGVTITVEPLGFTPSAGQFVTFIGFSADETQTYRYYG